MTPTVGKMMTLRDAAKHLGVTRQTLTRWIRNGDGPPYYTLGNRRRFSAAELDRWLAARRSA